MEDLGLIIAIASCMIPTVIVLVTKKKKQK